MSQDIKQITNQSIVKLTNWLLKQIVDQLTSPGNQYMHQGEDQSMIQSIN